MLKRWIPGPILCGLTIQELPVLLILAILSKCSNKKDSLFYSLFDARHIPPPPTMPHFWQYPEYRTFASRYATLQNLPKYLRGPSKTDLARTGFIYTQYGDRVTCFCCGMTLCEWEPVDDAYREHLRWSRYCHFAQMVGSM